MLESLGVMRMHVKICRGAVKSHCIFVCTTLHFHLRNDSRLFVQYKLVRSPTAQPLSSLNCFYACCLPPVVTTNCQGWRLGHGKATSLAKRDSSMSTTWGPFSRRSSRLFQEPSVACIVFSQYHCEMKETEALIHKEENWEGTTAMSRLQYKIRSRARHHKASRAATIV